MLSLILSRLFQLAFLIYLAFSLPNLYVQVKNEPIVNKRKNGYSSYGIPGISVPAFRSTDDERRAPDTIINYTARRRNDTTYYDPKIYGPNFIPTQGNATWSSEETKFIDRRPFIDSIVEIWKKKGDSIVIDTEINLLLSRTYQEPGKWGYDAMEYDYIPDGRVAVITSAQAEQYKWAIKSRDTFPDQRAAVIFTIMGRPKKNIMIRQQGIIRETLTIKAANNKQLLIFVASYIITTAAVLLMLLTLARLFKNFHRKEYFTMKNVKLLRNTGIFLLIPQLVCFVIYWTILFDVHPAKLKVTGSRFESVKQIASYQLESGIEYQLVFLALGILVLSYIFRNGLKLQRDLEYTT